MIEPEMAFCDLNDNQDLAEAFSRARWSRCWTPAARTWTS